MEKIVAHLSGKVISSNSSEAFSLYKKSSFGEPSGEKMHYLLSEAIFLVEKGKMDLFIKTKKIPKKELLKKMQGIDKRINIKYPVFKNLREKGYIIKTALKYGADFRAYERGSKPKKGHSKWVIFTAHESEKFNWHEFSSKNRVAHSTKKNLLIAIVDEENDVSYYEVKWIRP